MGIQSAGDERYASEGLSEEGGAHQYVDRGEGEKSVPASGFGPARLPAAEKERENRQDLHAVQADHVRDAQVARLDAPVHERQAGAAVFDPDDAQKAYDQLRDEKDRHLGTVFAWT